MTGAFSGQQLCITITATLKVPVNHNTPYHISYFMMQVPLGLQKYNTLINRVICIWMECQYLTHVCQMKRESVLY